jgi:hypothetical protein
MRLTESRAAKLVALLVALPLVGFLPRVLRSADPAAKSAPHPWMNALLITAGTWPLADGLPDMSDPAVAELVSRSTSIANSYSPSPLASVAAASLFSGLRPVTSGVDAVGERLPAGTWTIASGLAEAGTSTAAFLEEPLVREVGIAGFEVVEEGPFASPAAVAERVLAVWARETDRPTFVWVHFASAGVGGARVGRLLQTLEEAPGGLDEARRAEGLILTTAFASDGALGVAEDSGFRVPLSLALPADLFGGLKSPGMVSLVDVPQVFFEIVKLDPPAKRFDARPSIVDAFKGSAVANWILLQGPEGHVLRRGIRRLSAPGLPPADSTQAQAWTVSELGLDRDFERLPDDGGLYGRLMGQLLE